jgi:hypothetical protein
MKRIKYSGVAIAVLGGIALLSYYSYTYVIKYELFNNPYYGSYI